MGACRNSSLKEEHSINYTSCFCVKMLLVVNNLTGIFIAYQTYIYIKKLRYRLIDWKIVILICCLLNQLNVWFHYSFMGSQLLGETWFLFEISRFFIFFLIFYYYCQKAGKLLPNHKKIQTYLRILFGVSIPVILIQGVYIWQYILHNHEAARALCRNETFRSYSYSTLVMCTIFMFLFVMIKKSIESRKRETKDEIFIFDL